MSSLNKTSLYKKHIELKAKILPFAGYMMPINYPKGIQFEYDCVRNDVGLFDVSHMGQIKINGNKSINFIKRISVNNIDNLKPGDAQYTAICNADGGIIDDVILYKFSNYEFMFVVNGANRDKVYKWMQNHNVFDCSLNDQTFKSSLIAIQGPNSRKHLEKLFQKEINLSFYTHNYFSINSDKVLLSRTGYTGELGFELLGESSLINYIWNYFVKEGINPCGLAVRDILRMEMKYCLYGNDINEDTSPIEAGLGWIVKNKDDFIGKEKIDNDKNNGISKKLLCIKMIDKCIPRTGYNILYEKSLIGEVVSGTFSIKLNSGIALAYISSDFDVSNYISIEIRGKEYKGKIVTPPFLKNTSLHS